MDRHDDQNRPEATRPRIGVRPAERLAIPGHNRPTLWRARHPQQPGCLSAQLAQLLLDEYTKAGDVVLDIDDDVAFAATAATMRRRHHALGGAQHLAAIGHAAGYLDLVLLHWPRPAVNPQWLLRACRALLGATGCLVVAVSTDAEARVAHLSALGGVAATAALRATGHVAVCSAEAATPVAVPGTVRGRRRQRQHARGRGERPDPDGETSPHTDLLIFGVEEAGDA